MFCPAWPKQLEGFSIALHSLSEGTWSALMDPPPSRASTWPIRSPLRTARTSQAASVFLQDYKLPHLRDAKTFDISGTASSSLFRMPLEALTPHDGQNELTPLAEPSMTSALRLILWTSPSSSPSNLYVGSTMVDANLFFASEMPIQL